MALLIKDPEHRPRLQLDDLRRLYGLTRAEARFAITWTQEVSLPRTAERLKITEGSARWYLKRVFHKTDVNSQAELVRLLIVSA